MANNLNTYGCTAKQLQSISRKAIVTSVETISRVATGESASIITLYITMTQSSSLFSVSSGVAGNL
jgi:hypothetical protein